MFNYLHSSAAVTAGNKSAIGVLAATLSGLGVLDTGGAVSGTLSLTAPVEDPVVRVGLELAVGRGGAGIRLACAVGSTVVGVVLVVGLKDGEGLGRRSASVVGALGCLNGGRNLCGYFMTVSIKLHYLSVTSLTTAVQVARLVALTV